MSATRRAEKNTLILFVVNDPRFFVTHRLALAEGIRNGGYTVHVAAPGNDYPAAAAQIQTAGFTFHNIPIKRQGLNPLQDVFAIVALYQLYKRLRPDIVHHVTVKPVLYGSLAARIAGIPAVVNAISGLGRLFATEHALARIRALGTRQAYSVLMRHDNMRVIFQNDEDRATFVRAGIVSRDRADLILGSGTQVRQFRPDDRPDDSPIVLFVGRILRQKGVLEFAQAAKILRQHRVNARFIIAGDTGVNRDAVSEEQLRAWREEKVIEFWGWCDDIPAIMRRASIVCLPSYHEGMPKALIDACAAGRPIVATNIAGCRQAVVHGVNGYLVPPRDANSLASAIEAILANPGLRDEMGRKSRALAEDRFDIANVIKDTIAIYRALSP